MKKLLPIFIITLLTATGGAFYGGMKYAESKSPRGQFSRADFRNLSPEERERRFQELGANDGGSRGGLESGPRGRGFINGEIVSKDDASISLKLQDGGSRIVFFSESTEITQTTPATLDDLSLGMGVSVTGKPNPDGSLTASTIRIGQ